MAQQSQHATRSIPARKRKDAGMDVLTRALLLVALSVTLVCAMRWAVDITNTNNRQVSSNLSMIQGQLGRTTAARYPVKPNGRNKAFGIDAPTVEPITP